MVWLLLLLFSIEKIKCPCHLDSLFSKAPSSSLRNEFNVLWSHGRLFVPLICSVKYHGDGGWEGDGDIFFYLDCC